MKATLKRQRPSLTVSMPMINSADRVKKPKFVVEFWLFYDNKYQPIGEFYQVIVIISLTFHSHFLTVHSLLRAFYSYVADSKSILPNLKW